MRGNEILSEMGKMGKRKMRKGERKNAMWKENKYNEVKVSQQNHLHSIFSKI